MSDPVLAIGCPVAHRAWILRRWFDHVEVACERAGVTPKFVFVTDQRDECVEIIRERAVTSMVRHIPTRKGTDQRHWDFERYKEMARLRNALLELVRLMEPDAFLSLDSDILLHPDAIVALLSHFEDYDAIGGRCYMSVTGDQFPSWARLGREGQLQRVDSVGCFQVDVIMAIKLMGPLAYRVDYQFDVQGEDVGWSRACREAGLRLGWDGSVINKHILEPSMLDRVDARVGF